MGQFAIYVRRSYKRADSADVSDETQEQMARALLPKGATAEVITDSGGHQSGATVDRDGYQVLLTGLRAGRYDGIAVYDLSRLHRNAANMLALHAELERRQVALLVATMPATRFDGAIGRFVFGQLALAAQLQRDLDSERMASQCRAVFEAGGHRGLDPFGYRSAPGVKPRTLEVVEPEAEVVRRIWRDLALLSFEQIAIELNREGVRHRVDRPWTRDALKDIARRGRFYLGYVTFKRGLEERPGRHAAIIDEITWRDGVVGMRQRVHGHVHRASRHRFYLLAGLIRCGCGATMRGVPSVSRGKEWLYYRCSARCGAPTVRAPEIEAAVLARIAGGVVPSHLIEDAREELRDHLGVPRDEGKLRRRMEVRRDRLAQLFAWGDIDEGAYRAQRAEIDRDLAMLPDEDKLLLFDRHRRIMVQMAENIANAEPEELKEIVRMVIARVGVEGRGLGSIEWTGPARPFFEPEELGNLRPRTDSNRRRRP